MPQPEPVRLRLAALAATAGVLAAPDTLAASTLRPVPLPEDDYVESFTFVADLDDGTYVQAQLGVTNLGPDAETGFCRVLVRRPGAPPWTGSSRFGRRWSHAVTGPGSERLDVGTCAAASGPGGTVVRAALGGRAVAVSFATPAADLHPAAAEIAHGVRAYRAWILQHPAPVSVRLDGFGVGGALAGGGYGDHSRSNVPYRKLARSWVRFRALRGDRPVLVLARQAPDGSWSPAWARRGPGDPLALSGVQVLRGAGAGAFNVALAGGLSGLITGGPQIYRFASLSELGPFGRLVAPFVGNAVTYTQRATLSPTGEAPIDGILEVSVFEE